MLSSQEAIFHAQVVIQTHIRIDGLQEGFFEIAAYGHNLTCAFIWVFRILKADENLSRASGNLGNNIIQNRLGAVYFIQIKSYGNPGGNLGNGITWALEVGTGPADPGLTSITILTAVGMRANCTLQPPLISRAL